MKPDAIRATYKDLAALLKEGEAGAPLAAPQLARLAEGLRGAARLWDFAAVVHVFERLEGAGAIAVDETAPPPLQDAYASYIAARLRLVPFKPGYALLRGALDRLPEHEALLRLQALYLWQEAPDQLVRLHKQGMAGLKPASGAIRGEVLARMGAKDRALQLPAIAPLDRPARLDMLFVALNALDDPDRRLSWLNAYFEAQGLTRLAFSGEKRFGMDHLAPADDPAPGPEGGPKVSVVMPAWNAEAFVERAALSILGQGYRDLELICVDDGSTDGTGRILASLARRDPRVTVLSRTRNDGTYTARNEALKAATGELVTFHDADDWAHPDRIAREVSAFLADPELIALNSAWVRMDDEGRVLLRETGRYADPCPAAVMMRREPVLARVGMFAPHRVGADSEYRQRIQTTFGMAHWKTEPAVLTLGRSHPGSLTQGGSRAPLDRFGWSVPRALYRASWLDALVTGKRTGAAWAPVSIRRQALPVEYGEESLFVHDRLARLGEAAAGKDGGGNGGGDGEDILVAPAAGMSAAALSVLARLVAGGRQAGYRMGVALPEGAEGEALAPLLPGVTLRAAGEAPRAAAVLLAAEDDEALALRLLAPQGVKAEPGGLRAARTAPAEAAALAAPLADPALEAALPLLAATPREDLLVVARADLGRFWQVEGTRIAVAALAAPEGLAGTLTVTGEGWSAAERDDLARLAARLERRALAIAEDVEQMAASQALPALKRNPAPAPLSPEIPIRLQAPGVSRLLGQLAGAATPLPPAAEARPAGAVFQQLLAMAVAASPQDGRLDGSVRLLPGAAPDTPEAPPAEPAETAPAGQR